MLEPDDDLDRRLAAMEERLEAVARDVMATEMLDSVCITATYQEGGKSCRKSVPVGNVYATLGALREWLNEH